jgi:hypothetical protein
VLDIIKINLKRAALVKYAIMLVCYNCFALKIAIANKEQLNNAEF